MPKGYLICHIRVHDMEKMQQIPALTGPAIAKYGGQVLVQERNPDVKEGPESGVAVVIEFKDIETARAFYNSDDYAAARAIRQTAAETDLILAQGM